MAVFCLFDCGVFWLLLFVFFLHRHMQKYFCVCTCVYSRSSTTLQTARPNCLPASGRFCIKPCILTSLTMISDKQTAPLWKGQKKIYCSDVYLFACLERSVISFSIHCLALFFRLSLYTFSLAISLMQMLEVILMSRNSLIIIKAV